MRRHATREEQRAVRSCRTRLGCTLVELRELGVIAARYNVRCVAVHAIEVVELCQLGMMAAINCSPTLVQDAHIRATTHVSLVVLRSSSRGGLIDAKHNVVRVDFATQT